MTRILLVLVLAATIGPCVYREAPREVSRWYLAGAIEERKAGHKEVAEAQIAQALKWAPGEPGLLLQRAEWRLDDGKYEAALADCQTVAEASPDDFRTLFLRSQIFQRLGRHAEALADWKAIDRLSEARGLSRQEWEIAWQAIAEDRAAGRKTEAYDRLALVIGWSPGERELVLRRAAWRMMDGEYSEAVEDYTRADKLDPENAGILLARSQALQYLKRHNEAIADCKMIEQLSRKESEGFRVSALNGLAYARALGNVELEDARKGIDEALKSDPKDAAMLDTRGFVLYRLGKYDAALKDMNIAVAGGEEMLTKQSGQSSKTSPEYLAIARNVAVIRYHRALVLEKLGRHAEAKADRARAKMLIGREPDEMLF